jgi:hypothetical protein
MMLASVLRASLRSHMSLARRIAWLAAAVLLMAAVASLPGCGSSGGGATESTPSEQTASSGGGATESTPSEQTASSGGGATESTPSEQTASSGGGATESTPSEQTAPPPGGAVARECTPALRVTGVDCAAAEAVVEEWEATASCRPSGGQSESACSVGAYRCLAVEKSERRGVFCARPGRSIVFVPKSG